MTCDHARPGIADQRAALAMARAILDGATPAAAREAAGDRACPACTAVVAMAFGFALATSVAGEPSMTELLRQRLLAAVDAAEDELRSSN